MLRFLLSAASVCVLVTASLFFPGSISAGRCVVAEPTTLLSLYRRSQFIYVAKFDKLDEGEASGPTAENPGYRTVAIRKHYSISSSLKGESRKILVLEETEYRSISTPETEVGPAAGPESDNDANAEQADTEEVGTGEREDDDGEIRPGDSVLLFLTKEKDRDELSPSDYSDGLKKLTPEAITAYTARIRELNEIFDAEKPSYSSIVTWLVRCAEDPLTRWEGTYELLRSFQNMEWEAERAKETPENPPAAEPDSAIATERFIPEQPKRFDTGDANFARELTEGQKLILTDLLLKREGPASGAGSHKDHSSMEPGDRELIELVKRWGDSKVASNFVEQLKYLSSDVDLSSELMGSIAAILGDEGLNHIAERYAETQWENDEEEVAAETENQGSDPERAEPANEQVPEIVETSGIVFDVAAVPPEGISGEATKGDEIAAAETAPDKAPSKKKTYGELRAELIKKFVERAERLLSMGGSEDDEN